MITTPVHDGIRAFAAAVRTHLDDLPADDVDDLLDGLEADLSDQAAEAGDAFTLPDAATYAAELRAAAGLPERDANAGTPQKTSLIQRAQQRWQRLGESLAANPAGAWLLDLLSAVRPVWWLVRAAVWYVAVFLLMLVFSPFTTIGGALSPALVLTRNPGAWLLLLGAVLLSVQWGRGRWLPRRWLHGLAAIANIGAIVLLPFFLAIGSSALTQAVTREDTPSAYVPPGLSLDGERVRNIFAFDAEGNAIPLVQLYTQDGTPLTTVGRDLGETYDSYFYGGGGPVPVPYLVPGGSEAWNVFPLREIPAGQDPTWTNPGSDVAKARDTTFPFLKVQPLPDAAAPTPGASPTPAGPSSDATPAATQPAPTPTEAGVTP
ncbi:hypothetical protein NS220_01210 [Microbacterium testaceum]|uniref:Uncharacterized protein n=1 Tax=Microbacterium testaceum TaxID=2033 RepID=A0A147F216_MICTE|nr:hypothetical protein [Microbacterium testaceum]KTR96657.1 hypothetical protein NS220_01210 [Microbacterium testaceum]